MIYTVADAAEKSGVVASTLRYYDKEGLLPGVERTSGGARLFAEHDMAWIAVIERLKDAGLTIKEIKRYSDLVQGGDETLEDRRNLLHERKTAVEAELDKLQLTLKFITYKCWFYDEAARLGSEDAVRALSDNEMPEEMRIIRAECLASRY